MSWQFYDNIWQYTTIFDNTFRQYTTRFDNIRQYTTIFDNIWQDLTIYGNTWQYMTNMTIRDKPWENRQSRTGLGPYLCKLTIVQPTYSSKTSPDWRSTKREWGRVCLSERGTQQRARVQAEPRGCADNRTHAASELESTVSTLKSVEKKRARCTSASSDLYQVRREEGSLCYWCNSILHAQHRT